jgi:uncharacterized membrane protein
VIDEDAVTAGPNPKKSSQILWISIGVVVLAAVLRFFRLGHQSLWFDEGMTLDMTDNSSFVENFKRFYHLFTGGERFQPLYNLSLPYWRLAFGDGEIALRSFSALVSLGAVVFVTLTARRLYGGVHAIWTAALAATSSFAIFYSQEARPYALLMFLSSAQVFCLTPLLAGGVSEQTATRFRRAHVVVVAIGSFGSIFFCIFSAALAAAQLLIQRRPREWLRWWLPALLAAIPALVFFLGTGQASDPTHSISVARHGFPVFESIIFVVYGVLVGTTYGPSVLDLHSDQRWTILRAHGLEILALVLVLSGVTAALARVLWKAEGQTKDEQSASLVLLTAAVLVMIPATLLAVLTGVTWLPRHSFYLWIPIVLLVPLVRHVGVVPGRPLGAVLIVAFLCLNVYSLYKHYFRYDYSKGDYRNVAHYVMAKENVETPSVLAYGFMRLLRYYGDSRTMDGAVFRGPELGARIRALTNGAPAVLVILNHEEFWQKRYGASVPSLLAGMYELDDTTEFHTFKIFHFSSSKSRREKVAPAPGR